MIYLNDDLAHFDFEAALPYLSAQRREQALQFKFELGRKTSAAVYLLLCKGLREEYGITEPPVFEFGEHGKPSIVGHPDIHFNMSHCREAVACAVGSRPVGIDVESVHRYSESLARYTMNDQELQLIAEAARPEVAFIRLWTMKEARLKLTGEGINDHLKEVLADADAYNYTTVECLEHGYIYTLCEERKEL